MDEDHLLLAAAAGDAPATAALLHAGASASAVSTAGEPALCAAVRAGSAECVGILLRHGAVTEAVDAGGNTPLLLAVRQGQPAIPGGLAGGRGVDHGRQ